MKEIFRGIKFNFINVLAFSVLTYCFGYLFYITSSHFPSERLKDIGDIKIAVIQIIGIILGYFFVSSKKEQGNNNTGNNNTDMANVYYATTTTQQNITHINGSPLSTPIPADTWVNQHPTRSWYDKDSTEYYPSLVCPESFSTLTFSIDGNLTGQLVGGTHPPHRPR